MQVKRWSGQGEGHSTSTVGNTCGARGGGARPARAHCIVCALQSALCGTDISRLNIFWRHLMIYDE